MPRESLSPFGTFRLDVCSVCEELGPFEEGLPRPPQVGEGGGRGARPSVAPRLPLVAAMGRARTNGLYSLSLLVATCVLLTGFAHGATLKAPSMEGAPDEVVTLSLVLQGAKKVGTVDGWLIYDPAVIQFQKGSEETPWENAMVVAKEDSPGTLHLAVITGAKEGASGDGPAFTLQFRVVGTAGDRSPLHLKDVTAHDIETVELFPGTANGTLKVIADNSSMIVVLAAVAGAFILVILIVIIAGATGWGKR